MASAERKHPGGRIDPDALYSISEAHNVTGWGPAAWLQAKRNGLVVRFLGKRGYVHGRDLIDHILEHATTEDSPE